MSDLPVVHVHIFGTEYKIVSGADPEHTRQVARYVDRKMRDIASALSLRSVSKIAVLTALNLADELFKEQEAGQRRNRDVGEQVDRLSDFIDRSAWNE